MSYKINYKDILYNTGNIQGQYTGPILEYNL